MPGTPREEIARAATRLFAQLGFTATSVRAIAGQAGVDPALVIRHYGSKESLFLAVAQVEGAFADVLVPPLSTLGRRLVEWVTHEGDERRRGTHAALVWASSSPDVRQRLAEITEQELVAPLAALLHGPDARLRARLVAAQVNGLMHAMWIAQDPELLADPEQVATTYGAAVQRLITPR